MRTPSRPKHDMIRTSPGPALLHGSGAIDADDHFAKSSPCLRADRTPISSESSLSMDLAPSSPLLPSSSPSANTASVFSDCPEHKQQLKEGGYRLHSPSRGWTPYRRPVAILAHALELRFTEKTLRPGGDGLSLDEVKKVLSRISSSSMQVTLSQGQSLFSAGLKRLPNKALEHAILMKHASRETRRFRALASAWELKEARHYCSYLTTEHQLHKIDFSKDIATLETLI